MPRAPSKKFLERQARVAAVLPVLKQTYPEAACSLDFRTPFQLLVATILSAQCTDERVNKVTKELFRKYKSPADLAAAPQEQVEQDIRSTNFYRNKAKSLRAMARSLVDEHRGKVPDTMDALTGLAGVGRKTANVVLGNAFGKNEGITVDTHVIRVCNRLKLTDHAADAVKIEQDLIPLVPREDWALWTHLIIQHGRAVCVARRPKCEQCPLLEHCPAGRQFMRKVGKAAGRAAKSRPA